IRLGIEQLIGHGYRDYSVMHIDWKSELRSGPSARNDEEVTWFVRRAAEFRDDRLISVPSKAMLNGRASDVFCEWWQRDERPEALFVFDDDLLPHVCKAVEQIGIDVPNDLAIVTLANAGRVFDFPVELMRIEFDPDEMFAAAWEMLQKLVSGEPVDEPIVLIKPKLREGVSLG
ncbi:MAG: substrate-binding domain-containing protein, partial [Armatimonadota bacterium]